MTQILKQPNYLIQMFFNREKSDYLSDEFCFSYSVKQYPDLDVHSKKTRSFNMSRIRSANTKPEMIVRKFLFSRGFRYRLHSRKLPGKPDIVLPKYKTVIFVHGCFWHGHSGCRYYVIPKTKTEWWTNKIMSNQIRDQKNYEKLILEGWNVITIFECDLKSEKRDKVLNEIIAELH